MCAKSQPRVDCLIVSVLFIVTASAAATAPLTNADLLRMRMAPHTADDVRKDFEALLESQLAPLRGFDPNTDDVRSLSPAFYGATSTVFHWQLSEAKLLAVREFPEAAALSRLQGSVDIIAGVLPRLREMAQRTLSAADAERFIESSDKRVAQLLLIQAILLHDTELEGAAARVERLGRDLYGTSAVPTQVDPTLVNAKSLYDLHFPPSAAGEFQETGFPSTYIYAIGTLLLVALLAIGLHCRRLQRRTV